MGGDLQAWFSHAHQVLHHSLLENEKNGCVPFPKALHSCKCFFFSQKRGREKESSFLHLAKPGYDDKVVGLMEIICSTNVLSIQGLLEKEMLNQCYISSNYRKKGQTS